MKTQFSDTHPQIDKVQIALLKKQSIAKKFAHVCSLSQTTIQLSKRAIARKNRFLDDKQVNLLFITHQYGKELADHVKKYLNKQKYGIC
ncbi:hypothetical protein JW824_06650 [bacterium]|nr:hypothetical protein [bacterium]RQV95547.1 MAG: hypothetical protein EH221_06140 [bacterium]